jgi:ribosomal protein S6--L-glutamate ligase
VCLRIGLIHEGSRPDWPIRDLQKHAGKLRIDLQLIRLGELFTHIGSKNVEALHRRHPINKFDAFIVRGLGWPTNLDRMQHRINLLSILEEMGKPVMNPPQAIILARDKERSLSVLKSKGFKVPETYVSEDLHTAVKVSRIFPREVIKPLQGSRGLGTVAVDNEDLAFHVLRTVSQTNGVFYQQRRINVDMGLRIFTVGGHCVGCMRLKPGRDSWKTNVSQRGVPSALKEFESEGKTAIEAAKTLGCWYAGVDLLVDKNAEEFVTEVNASPSWRVFSRVTHTEPAEQLLDFLKSKAS